MRCVKQNAVPIVKYNDTVSFGKPTLGVGTAPCNGHERMWNADNDETASVIATLVHPKYLLIFTSVDGIYMDPKDPTTLVDRVEGKDADEVIAHINELQKHCFGASRSGAGGARAKLEFIKEPILQGTTVMIANSRYGISDVLSGNCPRTVFRTR